jgi:uncharacterized membrane protein
LTLVAVVIGVIAAVGVAILWPRHNVHADTTKLGLIQNVYGASVVGVRHGPCGGTADAQVSTNVTCAKVTFRLTQGPDKGQRRTIEFAPSPSTPHLSVGDKVVLNHVKHAQSGFDYTYNDRQRRSVLLWLSVIFAVAVIALGRWRGLAALVGLGASLVVIIKFMMPSMLDGNSAPAVAIVGATVVAYLALYLANGIRPMTTVALLGTLGALALTVVLATVFTELAHFTGATNEDALLVSFGTSAIDLKGLVLAGMVLGALGALDDITITQASSVGELREANPTMTRRELYTAGMRIGRDHISSTVNTLALAYAGAALPLLILFTLSAQSLGTVANGEIVAVEIVATLVGSIGLVAAVPISTWFAALVATEGHPHSPPSAHEHAQEEDALAPVGARSQEVLDGLTRRERRDQRSRRSRKPRPVAESPPVPDLLAPRDGDEFWTDSSG